MSAATLPYRSELEKFSIFDDDNSSVHFTADHDLAIKCANGSVGETIPSQAGNVGGATILIEMQIDDNRVDCVCGWTLTVASQTSMPPSEYWRASEMRSHAWRPCPPSPTALPSSVAAPHRHLLPRRRAGPFIAQTRRIGPAPALGGHVACQSGWSCHIAGRPICEKSIVGPAGNVLTACEILPVCRGLLTLLVI